MRQTRSFDTRDRAGVPRRAPLAGVQIAVAGSIALTLTAPLPAQAETTDAAAPAREHRLLRGIQPATAASHAVRAGAVAAGVLRHDAPVRSATEAAPASYVVQPGDTVSAIAARFGLRTTDVLALNGLGWRSVIHPGQTLQLTTAAPAAEPGPSAPPPTGTTHTVRAGDTVSAIARQHGVTVDAVLAANGLGWSTIIYPGQTLEIPGAAGPAASVPPPAPAPASPPASGAAATYTIVAGDTITAIALRHGVTVDALLAANGLGRSSIIYPGQTVAIPAASAAPSVPAVPGLSSEQVANAQLIIRIGRELGVPDRGIAIALGTAMQESSLRNVTWGDRDSLGLYQQRPSFGWGTAAEVQDAERATRAFYGGVHDPNGARTRGLLDIPGWQNLTFAQAAQAVQISAFPDAYARWEAPAYAWLAALG